MNEKKLATIESQLERFVETAFANLFRKTVNAHDMVIKLARCMTNNLQPARDADPRAIAPDKYIIHLHPKIHGQFQSNVVEMTKFLSQQLIELATESGYRMLHMPQILFTPNPKLDDSDLEIYAEHSTDELPNTAMMQPIDIQNVASPAKPYLMLGDKVIYLTQGVVNIGRSEENTIIVDDPFISRHHVQLRLRFGFYTLFDVNSRSGTLVNNIAVREHRLQSGDVIKIGNTQMIFMVEDLPRNTLATDIINPVQF
jgi:hypothetical protein